MLMFLRFFKPSLILRVASVFFLAMLMLLRHMLSGMLSIKTHHQIGTCFSLKSNLPHLVLHQFLLLLQQQGMGVNFGDFRIGKFFFNLCMSCTGFCFGHQVVMKIHCRKPKKTVYWVCLIR
jgi:hypothetical protein